MSQVIVSAGLVQILSDKLTDRVASWRIGLFKNNLTPTFATVFGDITVANFDGYALGTLGTFTTVNNGDGTATATFVTNIWTPTGITTPNTIYGFYLTTAAGALMIVERVSGAPYTVGADMFQFAISYKVTEATL